MLVTPEQVRHVSRGESEMIEQEDLIRQITTWRGGPTMQKGFIDERGPPPPTESERVPDADDPGPPPVGDSDGDENMEDVADTPHTPGRSSADPPPPPVAVRPDEEVTEERDPPAASAAGRGPSIDTDPNTDATTPTPKSQPRSSTPTPSPPTGQDDNLQGSSKRPHYEDLELDRERVRQRREALRNQRNVDTPVDNGGEEMELFLLNRSRDAFVASSFQAQFCFDLIPF